MGQQAGDGLDGVAHVLAAAEVAGQGPPVLQVGDAVLDPDSAEECALRCRSYISSYQSGAFFLNLRCGGVTTLPPVWAPRLWLAGVGENLDRRPLGQELDQS